MINTKSVVGTDSLSFMEATKGTKEHITCSGRGICDHTSGECQCVTGFASSDGQGNAGTYRDCGYKTPVALESYKNGF